MRVDPFDPDRKINNPVEVMADLFVQWYTYRDLVDVLEKEVAELKERINLIQPK